MGFTAIYEHFQFYECIHSFAAEVSNGDQGYLIVGYNTLSAKCSLVSCFITGSLP